MTAHAKVKVLEDIPQTVAVQELSAEQIQQFIRAKNSDIAIAVSKGMEIPLKFFTKTPILSAFCNPNFVIRTEKDLYFRMLRKKCYISEDLVHWKRADSCLSGYPTQELLPSPDGKGFVLVSELVPETEEDDEDEF